MRFRTSYMFYNFSHLCCDISNGKMQLRGVDNTSPSLGGIMKKFVLIVLSFVLLPTHNCVAQSAEELFQKGVQLEEIKGDLEKAIKQYKSVVEKHAAEKSVAARALLHLGLCYEKLGNSDARKAYERIVREYPGQSGIVAEARARLAALGKKSGLRENSTMSTKRVWFGEGADIEGTISSDGRYLSFTDWSTGDIAVRDLATGTNRRLTNNKDGWSLDQFADFSAISSDGKQVAYAWYNGKSWDLRVVSTEGSEPRKLVGDVDYMIPSAWSPDNHSVLAIFYGGPGKPQGQIELVSSLDGSTRILKKFSSPIRPGIRMSFSPDGYWIAYSFPQSNSEQNQDIFLIATDGSHESRLIEHPSNDIDPFWAPNGKSISFISDRGGSLGLWTVGIRKEKPFGIPVLVKADLGYQMPMGSTKDGSLYYGTSVGINDVYVVDIDSSTGKVLSQPKNIAGQYLGSNWLPDWSPDGQYLAYIRRIRNAGGLVHVGTNVIIHSMSTGEDRELEIKDFHLSFGLVWSRDGKSFYAPGADKDITSVNLYRIDVQSGKGSLLVKKGIVTSNGGNFTMGAFPDGQSIFYFRGSPVDSIRETELMTRNLTTNQERRIFTNESGIDRRFVTLSPDGKQFACWERNRKTKWFGIVLIPTDGQQPRQLIKLHDPASTEVAGTPGGIAWMPDGQSIVFAAKPDDHQKKMDLWRVPVSGGEPQNLGALGEGVYNLAVSPDGKRLAYSTQDYKPEVWVMENFLPKDENEAMNNVPQIRQVWANYPTDNNTGSFTSAPSPDGRYMTFVDWETGDLAIRELATGINRHLTNKGSWYQSSEFAIFSIVSPDGKQVAYQWLDAAKNYSWDIRTVGMNASSTHILYYDSTVGFPMPMDWSQDGKYILTLLASKSNAKNQIALLAVADGSVRVLKTLDWRYPNVMRFSPDGRYIAYDFPQQMDSSNRDIFLLSTGDGREVPLVKHPADDFLFGWAPDGKTILFASDRTGTIGVWMIRVVDGKSQGSAELIKPDIGPIQPLGFARNGSYFYGISTGVRDIYSAELDPATRKLVSPPTPAAQSFLGKNRGPEWSPDGKYLAYLSRRGNQTNQFFGDIICISSIETGEVRELRPKIHKMSRLRWYPDQSALLVESYEEKSSQSPSLFRVDAKSGESTIVLNESSNSFFLSNDGRTVFLTRDVPAEKDGTRLFVAHDLTTGQEKQIYRGRMWLPTPSPDNRYFAFIVPDSQTVLKILPMTGGEPREILRGLNRFILTWTPDDRYLVFGKEVRPGEPRPEIELWRVPATGGEPQKLDLPALKNLENVRIHPDGRRIVFVAGEPKGEVWVMENFLPEEDETQ